MQAVKSLVHPHQQKSTSAEEPSSRRGSTSSRRKSASMMTGQGTHFSPSHYRRSSRRDSGAFVGGDDEPYGEKGTVDIAPTDERAKADEYEYELPRVEGKRSQESGVAFKEDQQATEPARGQKSTADTAPKPEGRARADTKRGPAPPLRSSRDRDLGVTNESGAAVAAAASAISGKPVTKHKRAKAAPKAAGPEDTGVGYREDTSAVGPKAATAAPPEYADGRTEFVEKETVLSPQGVRETVERGTVVHGEPIREETEMRTAEAPQLAERGAGGEEAVDIPVKKGVGRDVTSVGRQPAEAVEEVPEEWEEAEEGETYVEAEEKYFEEEKYMEEEEYPEEEEWEEEEEEEEEEEWATEIREPSGAGKEETTETKKAPPTVMAPETPSYAAIAAAPVVSSTARAVPTKSNAARPGGTVTGTPAPVTPLPAKTPASPAHGQATNYPARAVPTMRKYTPSTVPGSLWPVSEERIAARPAEKQPAKEEEEEAVTSPVMTVPGTLLPVESAMMKEPARAAAPAEAPKRTEPKKEVDKGVDKGLDKGIDKAAAPAAAPAVDKGPMWIAGGQEPAGPEVRPGVGPPVRTRAVRREEGAAAAAKEDLAFDRAQKKLHEKEDTAIGKEKNKEDKIRDSDVKKEQAMGTGPSKEELKRQKEGEKRSQKDAKARDKEGKKQEQQQQNEGGRTKQQDKERAKQEKQEAKRAKQEEKDKAKREKQLAKQRKKQAKVQGNNASGAPERTA